MHRFIKIAYSRFLKIRGEPRQIARGLALGTMVGMTPFMGLHTVIAVFLAALCKWNKLSAAVGVFITNPITAPFIYPITYLVGKTFIGASSIPLIDKSLSFDTIFSLIKNSPLILVDLLAGGIITGLPLSIAVYFVALKTVENYRRKVKPELRRLTGRQIDIF